MSDTWHDNRPCDRLDRAFLRAAVGGTLAVVIPFSGLNYFILAFWASEAYALIFAFAIGALGFAPLMSALVNGSRFPASIRFDSEAMTWKTNRGKTYVAVYSRVLMILPSSRKRDWSGGICNRYHVYLRGRTPIGRWAIAVTPENRKRLEMAMKGIPSGRPISPGTRDPRLTAL